MARRFAKVSEEKIKTAFFYPSDLVNTKTTIPLRVGEERGDIYLNASRLGIYSPLFTSPSGDSCIIACEQALSCSVGRWREEPIHTAQESLPMAPTPHERACRRLCKIYRTNTYTTYNTNVILTSLYIIYIAIIISKIFQDLGTKVEDLKFTIAMVLRHPQSS